MIPVKQTWMSWLLLIVLTLLSAYLSEWVGHRGLFIGCVLLVVFLKGQQIIDVFMELKTAPSEWRMMLLSYVAIVPGVIAIIYWI